MREEEVGRVREKEVGKGEVGEIGEVREEEIVEGEGWKKNKKGRKRKRVKMA